jgi:hypothetical protein
MRSCVHLQGVQQRLASLKSSLPRSRTRLLLLSSRVRCLSNVSNAQLFQEVKDLSEEIQLQHLRFCGRHHWMLLREWGMAGSVCLPPAVLRGCVLYA